LNALIYLFDTFSRVYLLCFLLRLLLQVARADFYHPAAQFIVAVTNPLVVPARRLLPSLRKLDLPTLVVLVLLQLAVVIVSLAMRGVPLRLDLVVAYTLYQLATMTVWVYIVCIFIWIVLSWIQASFSPIGSILGNLVEPVLRPARRLLPPISGIDISPMIVLILLFAVSIALGDVLAIFVA
jgi:YggT family protein